MHTMYRMISYCSGGAWCVVKLNYIKLSLLYCVLYIIYYCTNCIIYIYCITEEQSVQRERAER